MAIIEDNFDLGNINNGFTEDVARALEEYLRRIAQTINTKPDVVRQQRSPITSDINYKFGTIWIDLNASPNTVYQLTEITGSPASATWIQLG